MKGIVIASITAFQRAAAVAPNNGFRFGLWYPLKGLGGQRFAVKANLRQYAVTFADSS